MKDVYTLEDWMVYLSKAIDSKDLTSIQELENISSNWLQTNEQTRSQLMLLESVSAMIEEITYLSEED